MSIQTDIIEAENRINFGTGNARALKNDSKIPAVIYGNKKDNINITVPTHEIEKRVNKASFTTKLLTINTEDGQTFLTIPHQIQKDPVTDQVLHVDFKHVDVDSEIKVNVKLRIINQEKSLGLKRGGTLNIINHKIPLICKAASIPKHIDVDVAKMAIGNLIHAEDLQLPEGAKLDIANNPTIITMAGRGVDQADGSEETTG